jgi:hypothetical protein
VADLGNSGVEISGFITTELVGLLVGLVVGWLPSTILPFINASL